MCLVAKTEKDEKVAKERPVSQAVLYSALALALALNLEHCHLLACLLACLLSRCPSVRLAAIRARAKAKAKGNLIPAAAAVVYRSASCAARSQQQ
jgi:hypothetical protein